MRLPMTPLTMGPVWMPTRMVTGCWLWGISTCRSVDSWQQLAAASGGIWRHLAAFGGSEWRFGGSGSQQQSALAIMWLHRVGHTCCASSTMAFAKPNTDSACALVLASTTQLKPSTSCWIRPPATT